MRYWRVHPKEDVILDSVRSEAEEFFGIGPYPVSDYFRSSDDPKEEFMWKSYMDIGGQLHLSVDGRPDLDEFVPTFYNSAYIGPFQNRVPEDVRRMTRDPPFGVDFYAKLSIPVFHSSRSLPTLEAIFIANSEKLKSQLKRLRKKGLTEMRKIPEITDRKTAYGTHQILRIALVDNEGKQWDYKPELPVNELLPKETSAHIEELTDRLLDGFPSDL